MTEKDPAVRRAAARTAVTAAKETGAVLPRRIYELAGMPVPDNATDELQRTPPENAVW